MVRLHYLLDSVLYLDSVKSNKGKKNYTLCKVNSIANTHVTTHTVLLCNCEHRVIRKFPFSIDKTCYACENNKAHAMMPRLAIYITVL